VDLKITIFRTLAMGRGLGKYVLQFLVVMAEKSDNFVWQHDNKVCFTFLVIV